MTQVLKKVYIMRGLPGSGKSTLLAFLMQSAGHKDYVVHSTDTYFVKEGRYQFDPTKLAENHHLNRVAYNTSLQKQEPVIVCDNTNIEAQHLSSFIDDAKEAGYGVEVINIGLFKNPRLQQLYATRNQHGVSLQVIQSMAKKSDSITFR